MNEDELKLFAFEKYIRDTHPEHGETILKLCMQETDSVDEHLRI